MYASSLAVHANTQHGALPHVLNRWARESQLELANRAENFAKSRRPLLGMAAAIAQLVRKSCPVYADAQLPVLPISVDWRQWFANVIQGMPVVRKDR